MIEAISQQTMTSGPDGFLAMVTVAEENGTLDKMTDEAKLDLSLKLIGLSDDELATCGLTRDGILGFIFGADAFARAS